MSSQDVEVGAAPGGLGTRPILAAILFGPQGGVRAGGAIPPGLIDLCGPLDRRDAAGFDGSDARHVRF